MSKRHDQETIARVARVYSSNQDAASALGVTARSFARLCKEYDIETPYGRKRRQTTDARSNRLVASVPE